MKGERGLGPKAGGAERGKEGRGARAQNLGREGFGNEWAEGDTRMQHGEPKAPRHRAKGGQAIAWHGAKGCGPVIGAQDGWALEKSVKRLQGGIDAGLRVCGKGFGTVGLVMGGHGQPKPPEAILAQLLAV